MDTNTTPAASKPSSRLIYTIIFILLAIITGAELLLSSPSIEITRGLRNTFFILFSMGKAGLVAAFYMHLRDDSKLYTYIFLAPVIMLLIFAYVMVIS
jgi:cytochrome c oxidase subunit IV